MNVEESSRPFIKMKPKKSSPFVPAVTERSPKAIEIRDSYALFNQKTKSIDKAQTIQIMETQRFLDSLQNSCREEIAHMNQTITFEERNKSHLDRSIFSPIEE